MDEVAEWQIRPLDICYPLVFFDAIPVKIRDDGFVRNKSVYIAYPAGRNEGNFGIWTEQTEDQAGEAASRHRLTGRARTFCNQTPACKL